MIYSSVHVFFTPDLSGRLDVQIVTRMQPGYAKINEKSEVLSRRGKATGAAQVAAKMVTTASYLA